MKAHKKISRAVICVVGVAVSILLINLAGISAVYHNVVAASRNGGSLIYYGTETLFGVLLATCVFVTRLHVQKKLWFALITVAIGHVAFAISDISISFFIKPELTLDTLSHTSLVETLEITLVVLPMSSGAWLVAALTATFVLAAEKYLDRPVSKT